MNIKLDKEKLEKIIEKLRKREELYQQFLAASAKYDLTLKEMELLDSLPKTLAEIEKSYDRLNSAVEGFVKDLDSYKKMSSKESSKQEKGKEKEVEEPIEIVEDVQAVPVETYTTPTFEIATDPVIEVTPEPIPVVSETVTEQSPAAMEPIPNIEPATTVNEPIGTPMFDQPVMNEQIISEPIVLEDVPRTL